MSIKGAKVYLIWRQDSPRDTSVAYYSSESGALREINRLEKANNRESYYIEECEVQD